MVMEDTLSRLLLRVIKEAPFYLWIFSEKMRELIGLVLVGDQCNISKIIELKCTILFIFLRIMEMVTCPRVNLCQPAVSPVLIDSARPVTYSSALKDTHSARDAVKIS